MLDFPEESYRRKAILLLNGSEVRRCRYADNSSHIFLDDEVHVLDLSTLKSTESSLALRNIVDANLLSAGTMLIQSPFNPDEYLEASDAAEILALQKHMHFITFCSLLGARQVTVKQVDAEKNSKSNSVKAGGSRMGIEGSATFDQDSAERLERKLALTSKMKGGEPDFSAAERFLREKRLIQDPTMNAVLGLARNTSNPLTEHSVSLNLSSEAQSSLRAIAKFKIPATLSLSADYHRVVKESREYRLKLDVTF